MPFELVRIFEIFATVSLLILSIAVLIHARQTRRRLDALNIEETARRLAALEEKAGDAEHSIEELGRDSADLKMRTKAIEAEISEIKEESRRYLGIFKTVLYGFDYIVQGCKSALEIGGEEKHAGEKRIISEE